MAEPLPLWAPEAPPPPLSDPHALRGTSLSRRTRRRIGGMITPAHDGSPRDRGRRRCEFHIKPLTPPQGAMRLGPGGPRWPTRALVLTRSHRTAERRITGGCRNFVLTKSVIQPGWE